MNKADMVERLAETRPLRKIDIAVALKVILDVVTEALCRDGQIGLGTLGGLRLEQRGQIVRFLPSEHLRTASRAPDRYRPWRGGADLEAIADACVGRQGLTREVALDLATGAFELIEVSLVAGARVDLGDFGSFKPYHPMVHPSLCFLPARSVRAAVKAAPRRTAPTPPDTSSADPM